MATRNSVTPSGGIFRSQLGGLIGLGPTQYTGRERLEQFGQDIFLHVPGARTPVRQDPRPYTELLSNIAYQRLLQLPAQRTGQVMQAPRGAFTPQRTQLPQAPHQPMH